MQNMIEHVDVELLGGVDVASGNCRCCCGVCWVRYSCATALIHAVILLMRCQVYRIVLAVICRRGRRIHGDPYVVCVLRTICRC
jgi:hypothetical protein